MSYRDELLSLIRSWDLNVAAELKPDTPLIQSGVFDSASLFNLVLWIEQQIGSPVDPTAVDLMREWNTVDDIVRFIERRRSRVAGQ